MSKKIKEKCNGSQRERQSDRQTEAEKERDRGKERKKNREKRNVAQSVRDDHNEVQPVVNTTPPQRSNGHLRKKCFSAYSLDGLNDNAVAAAAAVAAAVTVRNRRLTRNFEASKKKMAVL